MKIKKVNIILFLCVAWLLSCQGTAQSIPSDGKYSFKKGDPNGIGKWYLGREIAHVMGFQGIAWLERSNREKEESTSTLLRNMDIMADDIIADIGAGSGYHVFGMAPLAEKGVIYAVDIQDEMLEVIGKKKEEGKRKTKAR